MRSDASQGPGSVAVVLDVDGVVSPLNGASEWGDDVNIGSVFGPVAVSPTLCSRLDALADDPLVECWWLTSWTDSMRAKLKPFPGQSWPALADPEDPDTYQGVPSLLFGGSPWWKWEALARLLRGRPDLNGLVWCDDHLRGPDETWLLHDTVAVELAQQGLPSLLIAPQSEVGLTPGHLDEITAWLANLERVTS